MERQKKTHGQKHTGSVLQLAVPLSIRSIHPRHCPCGPRIATRVLCEPHVVMAEGSANTTHGRPQLFRAPPHPLVLPHKSPPLSHKPRHSSPRHSLLLKAPAPPAHVPSQAMSPHSHRLSTTNAGPHPYLARDHPVSFRPTHSLLFLFASRSQRARGTPRGALSCIASFTGPHLARIWSLFGNHPVPRSSFP